LPNISKSILRLQETLPKLGREKMENFNAECKAIKDMIDFEMKTTEDYISNMNMKERLEERHKGLQVSFISITHLDKNYSILILISIGEVRRN